LGLKYENVDIFYGHWEYLTGIWDLLWPFVTFCVHLVHFFRFWYHVPTKKNLATLALFTYTKKDFFSIVRQRLQRQVHKFQAQLSCSSFWPNKSLFV
jgi:hypothetical protein